MRILLVDDDATLQDILARNLARGGHSIETASDGASAWSKIQADCFDMIICDWQMPGMDGIELCRKVRAAESGRATYFVLLTGRDGAMHEIDGRFAGADDYLGKPFAMEDLLAIIRNAERLRQPRTAPVGRLPSRPPVPR